MEYSIVQLSEKEPISIRLDAEYYHPTFLEIEQKLRHGEWDFLGQLVESIKSFGAYSLYKHVKYQKNGIPFLRCKDIKNGVIDFSDVLHIDSLTNQLLWKSEIKPETVLLTMSGSVGSSAIAAGNTEYPINSNQDIAKIITKKRLNPYYLSVFLQSSYGNKLISRLPIGSVQQHVFLWQLEKLIIPLFSDMFQLDIEGVFKCFLSFQEKSLEIYTQAQTFLLSELGLTHWQPKHQLTFTKNYSETQKAGRIDAEYYQPKYEEIINAIKNYSGGWDTLGDLCVLVGHPSNPPYADHTDENKTFIVAQKHLDDYTLSDRYWNSEDAKYTTQEFITKNQAYALQKEDLVLYTVGAPPHIGKANLVLETAVKATIGSFVTLIRAKKEAINPFYLLVLFNSPIGYQLTNRFQRGMVQQYIYPKDLVQTVIPILPESIQTQIQRKVTESFKLRKQSKHLLECAKRAVEIAIEQNEHVAMKWLKNATQVATV